MEPIANPTGAAEAAQADVAAAAPVAAAAAAQPSFKSLFIGDLSQEVTEATLFETFSPVGSIISVRVCRDSVTRFSLGYGYVNFTTHSEAEAGLQFNRLRLFGKAIRVAPVHAMQRRIPGASIFVKNMPLDLDQQAFNEKFGVYGTITSSKVITTFQGKSKGYGYVHYDSAEAATLAIEKADGLLLDGLKISVALFEARRRQDYGYGSHQDGDGNTASATNVFFKNLPPSFDDAALQQLTAAFGAIKSLVVIKSTEGVSKGYGFVNFAEPEASAAAIAALNGQALPGAEAPLVTSPAQKRSNRRRFNGNQRQHKGGKKRSDYAEKQQGCNLYVKNLEDSVNDDVLRQVFTDFGTISSARVMRNQDGKTRNFGFVCFSDPADATKAIAALNGRKIADKFLAGPNNKLIDVSVALRKDRNTRPNRGGQQRNQEYLPAQMQGGNGGYYNQYAYGFPAGYPGGAQGMLFQQQAMMLMMQQQQQQMYAQQSPQQQQQQQQQQQHFYAGFQGQPQMPPQYWAGYGVGRPPLAGGNPSAGAPPAVTAQERGAALATELASTPNQADRKQKIGEHLYAFVQQRQAPSASAKITGMLLEMDESELLMLLEDQATLHIKVTEAAALLTQSA